MKDNFWSYGLAGIGAIAGLVYLFNANKVNGAPVTNVFPPLNTSDPALTTTTIPTGDGSADIEDQLPTSTPAQITSPITQTQKRPTYPIYYT